MLCCGTQWVVCLVSWGVVSYIQHKGMQLAVGSDVGCVSETRMEVAMKMEKKINEGIELLK